MKRKIQLTAYVLVLLLLLLAVLAGCAADLPEEQSPTPANSNETEYLARIAELEAEIQKQREDRYISDAAYDAKIEELESRIAALTPDSEATAGGSINGEELTFTYRLENGKAIITGYEGLSTLVTVPAMLDGHPVVAIGERAFEGKKIAAVILPEGLEAVGWFAFYGCETLIDVSIPASVTSIGYAVFDGCPNVSIVCAPDTYAAQYAASYGLPRVSP